jgi:hypothetical protein
VTADGDHCRNGLPMSRPDLDACPVQDRDPGTRSRRRTTSGRGVDAEHIRDSPASVESFFSRPGDFLRDVMEGLDSDAERRSA